MNLHKLTQFRRRQGVAKKNIKLHDDMSLPVTFQPAPPSALPPDLSTQHRAAVVGRNFRQLRLVPRRSVTEPFVENGRRKTRKRSRVLNVPSLPSLVARERQRPTVMYEKLAFSKPTFNLQSGEVTKPQYNRLQLLPPITAAGHSKGSKLVGTIPEKYVRRSHETIVPLGSRRSQKSDLSSQHGFRPLWKDDCQCPRCGMMRQDWNANDADSYQHWGDYPCVMPPNIDPTQKLSDDED